MIYKVLPLLLLFVSLAYSEGPVVVPRENCVWRGGDYGEISTCLTNEVPIGSCGSGRDADCNNYDSNHFEYDMIQCCPLETYSYGGCTDYYGDYGFDVSCLSSDDAVEDIIMEGVCGSGREADCGGYTHMVRCCQGAFSNGEHLYSSGSCTWMYGDYGMEVTCNSETEAVFGRCGSGRDPDCDGQESYHGVQCCDLVSLIPV